MIINTDTTRGKGKHWVALRADHDNDRSIEYYDPFAEKPYPEWEQAIHEHVKLTPHMLKYKINTLPMQHSSTTLCGFHCMDFIRKRAAGVSFQEATGWQAKPALISKSTTEMRDARDRFAYI